MSFIAQNYYRPFRLPHKSLSLQYYRACAVYNPITPVRQLFSLFVLYSMGSYYDNARFFYFLRAFDHKGTGIPEVIGDQGIMDYLAIEIYLPAFILQ